VEQALAYLKQADTASHPPIIQLVGPDPISKQTRRPADCRPAGRPVVQPARPVDSHVGRELEDFARLWHRESLLLPLALYLDACDLEPDAPTSDLAQRIRQFLYRSDGLFMLDTRDVWYALGQASCALDVRKPAPAEQIAAWEAALPAVAGPSFAAIGGPVQPQSPDHSRHYPGRSSTSPTLTGAIPV